MKLDARFRAASRVAGWHLLCSVIIALLSAAVVLGLWYPYPYRELSGGRELFLLIISVDVVCGPLLTFVLFNPKKSRRELWLDLSIVAVLQLCALGYGMWTTWQARPMYLALEVDRFKVVMSADIDHGVLQDLPTSLAPMPFGGVRTVALRSPKSVEEKNEVLFAAIEGGRDYAERPNFYVPYEGAAALKALERAKPLDAFLKKYPDQREKLESMVKGSGAAVGDWKYLPVVGRQDWVALLDRDAKIQGFLKGDGF